VALSTKTGSITTNTDTSTIYQPTNQSQGIDLFDKVNVPSVCVVENMASFSSPTPSLRVNDKQAWTLLQVNEVRLMLVVGLVG
jgi:hypothetical protein